MSEHDIVKLASEQHGVVSATQARSAGLTLRQIQLRRESAQWTQVRPGVYRVGGAPDTWRAQLLACCLAVGPDALVSHTSAARLWKLPGWHEDSVEITVGPHHAGTLPAARVHRCNLLLPQDRRRVDHLPVTGPELTLLHLGGVVSPSRLDGLVDDAIRLGLTTFAKVRWRLKILGRRGRNGSGVLRRVLDARDPEGAKAQSTLERRFFQLVRSTDLPKPKLQHLVSTPAGAFVARVDAAWPTQMLAVELDGCEFHAPLARWTGDLDRQNRLVALGWRVLRFTWWEVHDKPHHVRTKLTEMFRASAETPDVLANAEND